MARSQWGCRGTCASDPRVGLSWVSLVTGCRAPEPGQHVGRSLRPPNPGLLECGPASRGAPVLELAPRAPSGDVLATMGNLIICTVSQKPFQSKGFKELSHTMPSVNVSIGFVGSGVLKNKRLMFMIYFCGRQVHLGIINFTY